MKNERRLVIFILYIFIGIVLFVLGLFEYVDAFWSGMGGALIAIGTIRMIQYFRYRNDESYRERQEIEINDERNRFIRNKSWAWAGYLFVLITALSTIIFKLLGKEQLSIAAGSAVCLIIVLYWFSYLMLNKKY